MYPTRNQALALLEWAHERNPGPWLAHSKGVAHAAETIAAALGLDAQKAYVCGLLHDVGRYEGVRALHHVLVGYDLLMARGWDEPARICITHSFPDHELRHYGGGAFDVTGEELARIAALLDGAEFDDYDRLIQLCDALTWGEDVCLMEKRLCNVVLRHGTFEGMADKWRCWFAIKAEFEARIGQSLYSLFPECVRATFDFPC